MYKQGDMNKVCELKKDTLNYCFDNIVVEEWNRLEANFRNKLDRYEKERVGARGAAPILTFRFP